MIKRKYLNILYRTQSNIIFNINKSITICKGLMKWEYLFFKFYLLFIVLLLT